MNHLFLKSYHSILDLIAPPFCASCKLFLEVRDVLCSECVSRIQPVVSHTIDVTKTKQMRVLSVGAYKDPLASLVLAKSSSQRAVSTQLGKLMWQMSNVRHVDFEYIIPIPLHWTRYAWRGYNQAQEIAHVIATQSSKPIRTLITRSRRTLYLSKYSSDERAKNMQGVFVLKRIVDYSYFRDAHLLLVDDVMTTGATLREAAKELWKLKPRSITAVVAARVVR